MIDSSGFFKTFNPFTCSCDQPCLLALGGCFYSYAFSIIYSQYTIPWPELLDPSNAVAPAVSSYTWWPLFLLGIIYLVAIGSHCNENDNINAGPHLALFLLLVVFIGWTEAHFARSWSKRLQDLAKKAEKSNSDKDRANMEVLAKGVVKLVRQLNGIRKELGGIKLELREIVRAHVIELEVATTLASSRSVRSGCPARAK